LACWPTAALLALPPPWLLTPGPHRALTSGALMALTVTVSLALAVRSVASHTWRMRTMLSPGQPVPEHSGISLTAPWILAFCVLAALTLLQSFAYLGVLRKALPLLEALQQPAARQSAQGPPLGELFADVHDILDSSCHDGANSYAGAMLLFLSASCSPCRELARELSDHGTACVTNYGVA
jgi:hypothetical protein